MTQSVPRSSPVSRLLCLSLLLLFLLVPAQSWALRVDIVQPQVENWIFRNQISWTLHITKDNPAEQMLYFAKIKAWVDGEEQVIFDSSTPPVGAGLEYFNWIYNGRLDGAWCEHTFSFTAWVWRSTLGPPLFIPQWDKVEITGSPTYTETILNGNPSLTVQTSGGSDPSVGRLALRASAPVGNCEVRVNSQLVQLDSNGEYAANVQLSAGANTFTVEAKDTGTQLTTTKQVMLEYVPVSASLGNSSVDFTQPAQASLSVTSPVATYCDVWVLDNAKTQRVARLATALPLQPNEPAQVTWDGTADSSYPYVGANGKVCAGTYGIAVATKTSDQGGWTGWTSSDLQVANTSGDPVYSVVEAESSTVQKTGTWTPAFDFDFGASQEVFAGAAYPTAALTLAFSGTGVTVFYSKDASLTGADVYVDGSIAGHIDAYAETPATNCQFCVTGLTAGQHTVQLRPTTDNEGAVEFGADSFWVY